MRKLLLSLLPAVLAVFIAQPGMTVPPVEVSVQAKTISLQADKVPLREILRTMEKKAGLILMASPTQLDIPMSCTITSANMEELLQTLLSDFNYAVARRQPSTAQAKSPHEYLLWIYAKKPGAAQAKTTPQPPAAPSPPQHAGAEQKKMKREEMGKLFSDPEALTRQLTVDTPKDPAKGGVTVHSIVSDSPLAGLGIGPGDTISDINGTPIHSVDDLAKALTPEALGERQNIMIRRDRDNQQTAPIYIQLED